MPIYEFKCENCDHCFEKLVFKGDEKFVTCPECYGTQVEKKMSASRLIGSGFGAGSVCGTGPSGGFS